MTDVASEIYNIHGAIQLANEILLINIQLFKIERWPQRNMYLKEIEIKKISYIKKPHTHTKLPIFKISHLRVVSQGLLYKRIPVKFTKIFF